MSLRNSNTSYVEELNQQECKKLWNSDLNETSLLNQIKLVKKIIEELHDNIGESSDETTLSKSMILKRSKFPISKKKDVIQQSKKLLERADELKNDFVHLCKSVDVTTHHHTCHLEANKVNVKKTRLIISPPSTHPALPKTKPPKDLVQTNFENFNDDELNSLVDRILDTNPRKIMEKIFENSALTSIMNHTCPLKTKLKNESRNKRCRNQSEHELKNSQNSLKNLNANDDRLQYKCEFENINTPNKQSANWSTSTNSKSGQYTVYSKGPSQSSLANKSSNETYPTYRSTIGTTDTCESSKSNLNLNDSSQKSEKCSKTINESSYNIKKSKTNNFISKLNDVKPPTLNECHELMSNDSKTIYLSKDEPQRKRNYFTTTTGHNEEMYGNILKVHNWFKMNDSYK